MIPDSSTVVIGRREDLLVRELEVEQMTSVSGAPLDGRFEAQYRAHGEAVPALVEGHCVRFDEAQSAVAPGQTIAFYSGDEVVGGAVIAQTVGLASSPHV